ncbi:MAG: hypothetical protein ACRDD7_16730 [Peptostreptococcaceae bacterium]
MKAKISVLVSILSMFLFVGCSNESNDKLDEISLKLDKVQEELDKNEEKINELESKIEEYEKEEASVKPNYNIEANSNNEEDGENEDVVKQEFKIYTLDVEDTNKVKEHKIISIDSDKSIKEKLEILCKSLKEDYFEDDSIDIEIQGINEKGIATINLVNKAGWHNHLQGSTGGIITEQTIVKTLLQKNYSGEWIKGITVLIDGQIPEFDHAFSKNTFIR